MPDETQEPRTERASIAHRLKVWPSYYVAVADGRKPFEVRRDDRVPAFRTGDTLLLCEWDPATEQYTGRAIERRVTYCLRRAEPWVPDGYVVMGLAGDEYHAQPGNAPVSEREEGESRTRGRTPMPDETQEREASHATVLVVLDHAVEMLRRSPRGEREATAYQVAADNVQAAMREQEVAIDRLTRELREAREQMDRVRFALTTPVAEAMEYEGGLEASMYLSVDALNELRAFIPGEGTV